MTKNSLFVAAAFSALVLSGVVPSTPVSAQGYGPGYGGRMGGGYYSGNGAGYGAPMGGGYGRNVPAYGGRMGGGYYSGNGAPIGGGYYGGVAGGYGNSAPRALPYGYPAPNTYPISNGYSTAPSPQPVNRQPGLGDNFSNLPQEIETIGSVLSLF
jgi:hypothetical protein